MLLKEIKNIFHKELDESYTKEEVASFFYMLTDHYLGLERFILAMQPQYVVSKEDEKPLFEALSELRLLKPIQHILGMTEFMDLAFMVNKDVLIPRPETEELVRWIIEEERGKINKAEIVENNPSEIKIFDEGLVESSRDLSILDIGTGSGCIAISLAKKLAVAKVYGLDVSESALQVAKKNALTNEVEITFVHADILSLKNLDCKFDIIVSNPPYVRELEKSEMHQNVLGNEPEMALFVPDENPLKFYKAVSDFALENLKTNGRLFLEINQYLGKESVQLLQDHNFSEIELRQDLFGNDRMLKGVKKA